MRKDEFNSIKVSNEKDGFSRFEFGHTQNNECSFYNDNQIDIKDEINSNKVRDELNPPKKEEKKQKDNLEKLNQVDKTSSELSSSSSSSASSSSVSSSAAASSSAGAATSASAVAATVGAVVIAVPTIIAVANIIYNTKVVNPVFEAGINEIYYNFILESDQEDDQRLFGVYLQDPELLTYYCQEAHIGENNGQYFDLLELTTYHITVAGYENPDVIHNSDDPNQQNVKKRVETTVVDTIPSGAEIIYEIDVTTLEDEPDPDKEIDHIAITNPAEKTDYLYGDDFDMSGLEVSLIYTEPDYYPSEVIPEEDLDIDVPDLTVFGNRDVTIRYQNYEISYEINVSPYLEYRYEGDVNYSDGEMISYLYIESVVDENYPITDLTLILDEGTDYQLTYPIDFYPEEGYPQTNTFYLSNSIEEGEVNFDISHTVTVRHTLNNDESKVYYARTYENVEIVRPTVDLSFTLNQYIDYSSGDLWQGTSLTSYQFKSESVTMEYVNNPVLTLQSESFEYQYQLNPTETGMGLIDLIEDATIISGDQITLDILKNESFNVTVTYTNPSGIEETLTQDPITFAEESLTTFEANISSTYVEKEGSYEISFAPDYTGFGSLDTVAMTLSSTREGGPEYTSTIEMPEAGDTGTFSFELDDVSFLENVQVTLTTEFYNRTIRLFDSVMSFSTDHVVNGIDVSGVANYEDNIIYVTLDYIDSTGETFTNFEFTLSNGNNSIVTTLEPTIDPQMVRLEDADFSLDYETIIEYTYSLSYFDTTIGSTVSSTEGNVVFGQIDLNFQGLYHSLGEKDETEFMMSNSNSPFENIRLVMTDVENQDHTCELPIEFNSEMSMDGVVSFKAVEEENDPWSRNGYYQYQVYATLNGKEELFYDSKVEFIKTPNITVVTEGELRRDSDSRSCYFMPCLNIVDEYSEISSAAVFFAKDDGTDNPVSTESQVWSDTIEVNNYEFIFGDQNGYKSSGYHVVDISRMFSSVYYDPSSTSDDDSMITDGDYMKYTVYMLADSVSEAVATDKIEISFESTAILGATLSDGYLNVYDNTTEFDVDLAFYNNSSTKTEMIKSIDYIKLTIYDGYDTYNYYIDIGNSSFDPTGSTKYVTCDFQYAYTKEPKEASDPDLTEDYRISNLSEVVSMLKNGAKCTLNVYYTLYGGTFSSTNNNHTFVFLSD